MRAIDPLSTINRMVLRGMNIILLISTGIIAAEVCIFAACTNNKDNNKQNKDNFKTIWVVLVYNNQHAHANWDHQSS
jgi:hypothetical protein